MEPLAVSLHAVGQGRVSPGDTVAVVGDGAIGLGAVLCARSAGASGVYLVAKHRGRGELAKKLGATAVIYLDQGDPVQKLMDMTDGIGVNTAIECVGYPDTPQLAIDLTRNGGTTIIEGVFDEPAPVNFLSVMYNQKTIIGSPIYTDEAKTAIALMADKSIDPGGLITSKIPLKDAVEKGFEELLRNKEDNIKILLEIP